MDGSEERNDGTVLLYAISILRHVEIRSLGSPFCFDDSSLEVLTKRSDADNAIDCLVLSTDAARFTIEGMKQFLKVNFRIDWPTCLEYGLYELCIYPVGKNRWLLRGIPEHAHANCCLRFRAHDRRLLLIRSHY